MSYNKNLWTNDELSIVRANSQLMSAEDLLKLLPGRTYRALRFKMAELGIPGRGLGHRRTVWTEDMLATLKAGVEAKKSIRKIADSLGMRDPQPVSKQLQVMGMYAAYRRETSKEPWTQEEDDYLRSCGPEVGAQEIGARLGRTVSSIHHRSRVLGRRCYQARGEQRKPRQRTAPKPKLEPRKRVIVEVSRIHYCPDCHAPVSNWTEHFERMGHRAPWMRAA